MVVYNNVRNVNLLIQAKDISLSSLLGDPGFKKDDSLSSTPVKTGNLFSENLLFGDGSQDSFVKLDVSF